MPKFTGEGVPCNQGSGTQAGHGQWAVGSERWKGTSAGMEGGSSSAQPQPWALTPSRFAEIARVHWMSPSPKRMDKHDTVPVALTRLALCFRELRCRPWR